LVETDALLMMAGAPPEFVTETVNIFVLPIVTLPKFRL